MTLKRYLRKHYGGWHVWANGPHPAGWHLREPAERTRHRQRMYASGPTFGVG